MCIRDRPNVPYRQWVVGFPFELNGPLAFQPGLLAAVEHMVMDALSTWQKARAGVGHVGGILVRHRFGGSLNLHIHDHVLLLDGVYVTGEDGNLRFQQTPPPRDEEMQDLANTLHRRLMCVFKRRELLQEPSDSNEEKQLDALSACGQVALSHVKPERRGAALSLVDEDELEHPRHGISASVDGLNVYASAPLDGRDRELMERVCRYLLRGPLAQKRLSERPDGMLAYRLKKPDRRGNTVLVLSPQELLMRLCSLVPAPGHPSRKSFGILGGEARDRSTVVSTATRRKLGCARPQRVDPVASRMK